MHQDAQLQHIDTRTRAGHRIMTACGDISVILLDISQRGHLEGLGIAEKLNDLRLRVEIVEDRFAAACIDSGMNTITALEEDVRKLSHEVAMFWMLTVGEMLTDG